LMPLRISLEWLADLIDLKEPPEQLAEMLTLSGTEVERVVRLGEGWDDIVVARIAEISDITGSDHLRLAQLEIGAASAQVVTGAPNARLGDLVPYGAPGVTLPSGDTLGVRRFYGHDSAGMVLSPAELGISSEHDGLLVLGSGEDETGQPLTEMMPSDVLLVIEVTANRPDEL